MTGRSVIRGASVISMERAVGTLERVDIAIADGRISDIRCHAEVEPGTEVINGTGMIALPGFVDAHRHTWQTALRHRLPDATFGEYGAEMLGRRAPNYTAEDIRIGTLAGALTALDSGITTVVDWSHALNTPQHADAAIDALRGSGIRAQFAHGIPRGDGRNWTRQSQLPHPADIVRIRHEVLGDGLITLAMAARGPEMSTLEVTVADFLLAREYGIRISTHVGAAGLGPQFHAVRALYDVGLLGPDVTLIHLCSTPDDELAIVRDTGTNACVGPMAELLMPGVGRMPVQRLLAAGLLPALSTDTETVSAGDMFSQMRLTLAAARDGAEEAPMVTALQVLEMATVAGARAAGLDHQIGRLVPGLDADLVLVRGDDVNLMPATDPVAAVVLGAHAGNVDTVLVRGEVRKRHGTLLGVDLGELTSQVRASRDRLLRG